MSKSRKAVSHYSLALFLPLALGLGAVQAAPTPNSDDERILYALGVQLMLDLAPFQLNAKELAMVQAGMEAALSGKFAVDPAQYAERIQDFAQKRVLARAEIEQNRGKVFLKQAAQETGAKVSPSGLVMTVKTEGKGAKPQANSTVKVHYRGTLIDGTEFDSSIGRGEPATFPLNRVIPCWTDGLTQLRVGSKARLVCPPEIAYGNQGAAPAIPPGATLVFDVELIEIVNTPPLPQLDAKGTKPTSK
ncbi:MAG: FKBP-type peptidyl-prolyl cis-trans isomerase [Myxococcota bacterium]|nr:FKBP-type peptidyl-prolyl cis-trans isomerase [Myxococcota bacterium]